LQRDLVEAFFARERHFHLTGGAALAGYYLGHRTTEDLDLFSPPGPALEDAARALAEAARACGGEVEALRTFEDFRRLGVRRGEETCIVDLVIDRAPAIDAIKELRGNVRLDTLREIAASKLCTLLGRSEIKDLVDVQALLGAGIDLGQAVCDAERKDGGADPATLAWILDRLRIGPEAPLPWGVDPVGLERFRASLVQDLQRLAFERTRIPELT
jgi:hypothetical protein